MIENCNWKRNWFNEGNIYIDNMETLKQSLKTTQKYIDILAKNGINSLKEFLQYFPRTYEDRTHMGTLDNLIYDEKGICTTKGHIIQKKIFIRGRKKIYDIKFEDIKWNTGQISIYNSWFLASKIIEDHRYIIIGKPQFKYGKILFSHPEIIETKWEGPEEKQSNAEYNSWRIYPIYSELNGIKPGRFAKKTRLILDKVDAIFSEYLPKEFIEKFELMSVQETIRQIHYPENKYLAKKALQRIFFDRLLRIQLYSRLNKINYQSQSNKTGKDSPQWDLIKNFLDKLPFALTNAQKKVTKSIIDDIHSDKPMMRLLQWDVGSWKTIVATIAAYYLHNYEGSQSVFLAPLEVLANQHHKTLAKLLLPLGIRVELLTGSLPKSQKDKIKSDLLDWKIHIIVGTHALLQEDVLFKKLWLVVIDEQHKFWVKQRSVFKKFNSPDILQMSATPIPRSMALAFFGEFDVSIIDEMPAGRKPIITKIIWLSEMKKLKPRISTKINQGEKVFIVTPLIEESDKMEEVKAALTEFEETQNLFPELKKQIGLLHGKMKSKEKEEIMHKFKTGEIEILVSTTVIEVGVDIPEATIMIIKNAERFGLSQLHQLRWRIGRSDLQSYCFLETKNKTGESTKRLKAMEETNDGFKLAEIDLQTRGSWEILGTMQSGEWDIPIEVLGDIWFLERIQEWADRLLEHYPNLEGLDLLKNYLKEKMGDVLI